MKECSSRTSLALPLLFVATLLGLVPPQAELRPPEVTLPDRPKAVRFAVIGDTGTGGAQQYEVGEQMARAHEAFPFDIVLMLGDNLYGRKTPADYNRKFEEPYKPLLDEGVKFYASLGNHDDPNERYYKPFHMNGQRYYALRLGEVEFFALDSTYVDPQQLEWIKQQLSSSSAPWKICFFHHPLYSAAHYHGPDLDLRKRLEPIFQQYGVTVVLSGHEHVYERVKPQNGIYYFVLGNGGQLRPHDLRPSAETAKGFDTDRAFMLMEISGNDLYFQTLSRTGSTVDSGVIHRERWA
jgi:predicted MPP superfamily phosphohydrolase